MSDQAVLDCDMANSAVTESENEQTNDQRQKAINALKTIGVPDNLINEWAAITRTPRVWSKIVKELTEPSDQKRSFNQNYTEWNLLQKTLSNLQKVKFPTLCGWSMDDLVDNLRPYVKALAKKFTTTKSDFEDNCQNGYYGIHDALRSDAGISPFGNHVYKHIKTKIRRPVANDSLMTKGEHEYRPSQNIIHEELHNWLTSKNKITENHRMTVVSKQRIGHPRQHLQLISLAHKLGDLLNRQEIDELSEYLNAKYKRIAIEQRRRYTMVDLTPALSAGNPKKEWKKTYEVIGFLMLDSTLSEIVDQLVVNPNFHSKHSSLDNPDQNGNLPQLSPKTKDGEKYLTPIQEVSKKEKSALYTKIMKEVLPKTKLTPEQLTIANHLFGLNGFEKKNPVEIADNFGKYLAGTYKSLNMQGSTEGRVISRQRVTQYMKTLSTKFRGEIYNFLNKEYTTKVYFTECEILQARPELDEDLVKDEVCARLLLDDGF